MNNNFCNESDYKIINCFIDGTVIKDMKKESDRFMVSQNSETVFNIINKWIEKALLFNEK